MLESPKEGHHLDLGFAKNWIIRPGGPTSLPGYISEDGQGSRMQKVWWLWISPPESKRPACESIHSAQACQKSLVLL